MVEHVNIPNAHIHEPKGASTAPAGSIYVADGLGSGAWQVPASPTSTTRAFAQGGIVDNAEITDVVGTDTDVQINFNSLYDSDNLTNSGFSVNNIGTYINTSDATLSVLAVASLRLTATTADPLTYIVSLFKGATAIPGATARISVTGGNSGNVTLNSAFSLVDEEYISLRIRAVGHSTDVVVDSVSLSVIGVG